MGGIDGLVTNTINSPRRTPTDVSALVRALRGEAPAPSGVLSAFFTEVPLEAIARFAAAHHLSEATLLAAWRRVARETGDERPELDDWLQYLGRAPA